MGVAGFVLALIGLFLVWTYIFGFIVWILGLIFSFIGVFKAPRGLAIAGLVISCIWLIVFSLIFGAIMSLFL